MKFLAILKVFLIILLAGSKLYAQDSVHTLATFDRKILKKERVDLPNHEYKVYYYKNQLNQISEEEAGEHLLGQMIAKKLYLLDKKYLYSTFAGGRSTKTRILIHKPIIYNAVKEIERYMLRMIKKGEMFDLVAEENLNTILDVAIVILTQETKWFENELESCRSIENMIDLFIGHVKLIYL